MRNKKLKKPVPKKGDVPKEKPGTESLRKDRVIVTKYVWSHSFHIGIVSRRYETSLLSSLIVWIRCTSRWPNSALPIASVLISQCSNTSLFLPSSCSHSWRWDSTSIANFLSIYYETALFRSQHRMSLLNILSITHCILKEYPWFHHFLKEKREKKQDYHEAQTMNADMWSL